MRRLLADNAQRSKAGVTQGDLLFQVLHEDFPWQQEVAGLPGRYVNYQLIITHLTWLDG